MKFIIKLYVRLLAARMEHRSRTASRSVGTTAESPAINIIA